MKRLHFAAAGMAVLLAPVVAPVTALAQQLPDLSQRGYPGYGHMWQGTWGWGGGFMFYPIGMLLVLFGIVFLGMLVMRAIFRGTGMCHHYSAAMRSGPSSAALDILETRYAKGEIDKAEFEEKRQTLSQRPR